MLSPIAGRLPECVALKARHQRDKKVGMTGGEHFLKLE